jgi:hypothetical protein
VARVNSRTERHIPLPPSEPSAQEPLLWQAGDRVISLNQPGTVQHYLPNTLLVYVLLDGDQAPCLEHQRWLVAAPELKQVTLEEESTP